MRKDDVLRLIDAIHRDRGVDREILFCALEEALATATRKRAGIEEGLEVKLDRRSGQMEVICTDETVEIPSTNDLGRIAAQTTKQVFMQKIREAERDKVHSQFASQVGSIVSGVVHKLEGPNTIIQLSGETDALLPRSERVQSERLHIGDRVRVLIKEVRKEGSRVTIIVSRKDDDFVRKLFEVEVPEIAEGHIRVMRVARDPGYRCKVAVYPMEQRVDAVGACLGVRGTRIRNINDEVGQEKIDIIQWSDSLEELVQNSLKPAKGIEVDHIFSDIENQSVFVLVADDQKPLAIGVGGRNVRLAARIVGWDIEIKTPGEYEAEIMEKGGDSENLDSAPNNDDAESVPQEDEFPSVPADGEQE